MLERRDAGAAETRCTCGVCRRMNLYRQHREALAAIERDYPLPPRSSATYRGVQRQRAEARRQVQARMQRLATELGVELPDTIH